MVGPFAIAGYDVLAPLDGSGRRWRAICLADGQPVVLRRWIGARPRIADVRRHAARWGSVAIDGVVAVRDVLADGADLVVVSDVGGDPLDLVLSRRRQLSAGQVVTLAVGIARVLQAAHERGLAHGRLDASSVVLDAAGRPRLTDYVLGEGADAAADVAALAALASTCLGVDAPAALTSALEDAHEAARDAADLAMRVLASVQAEPLTARIASPQVAIPLRQESVSRLRAAVGVTVAVALLATVIGMWSARQEPAAGAPVARVSTPKATPSPPASPPLSLTKVAEQLDRRRTHALAQADAVALATVDSRGTSLWRLDSRAVSRLTQAHAHLRGLRVRVTAARVLSVQTRRAVVRVVDALSSYEVVDGRGEVVDRQPARPAQAVDLVLVRDNRAWHIRAARTVSR